MKRGYVVTPILMTSDQELLQQILTAISVLALGVALNCALGMILNRMKKKQDKRKKDAE